MRYIYTPKFDGTFTMSWIGAPMYTDEISTQLRDIKTFSIVPLKSISSITNFTDVIKGETDEHYFKKYFSYSNLRSGVSYSEVSYSESMPITGITQVYCALNDLYLNLSYYRIDENIDTIPTLAINTIVIEGTYNIEETDTIVDIPDDDFIIFSPKNIYKVFKLTGYEVYGVNTNNLQIKYRFTQDNGRTYTPWEPLTTENISTVKINPIRFAQVEYSVSKKTNGITSKIYDIILLGDFQNINKNYLKLNRYGVREDCSLTYPSLNTGTTIDYVDNPNAICLCGTTIYQTGGAIDYNRDWITKGLSCYLSGNVVTKLSSQVNDPGFNSTQTAASDGIFNPYAGSIKIGNWYAYLANTVGKIFGWTVDYHLTDPDGKGIDSILHEYQLYNIVDTQKIKIIVPENTFPDNQVQVNEYMLDMMDTFQVIILKDEFHNAFGIEKRPSQKDIIFFCQANRMYRVKSAQVKRDVMYMGIYYNVVLEKYEKLANEKNLSTKSTNLIDILTNNNTIDSLFGVEIREQEDKIVSKQLKPITHEVYRLNVNPKLNIIKKDIYNSLKDIKIADSYYNLSSLPSGITAVSYTYKDSNLKVSDNRSFNVWFNFNNIYDTNKAIDESTFRSYNINSTSNFEFLNNYDSINNKGYKLSYKNSKISLTINNIDYSLTATGLTTNMWYGLTVNLDNRQREVSLDLFKRRYNYKITMFTHDYKSVILDNTNTSGITYYNSNGYRPVKNTEIATRLPDTSLYKLASIKYVDGYNNSVVPLNTFNIDQTITINSSDIKLTNIRIYDDVIPDESKSNLLLQRVVQDSNNLILADNATKKLFTKNIYNDRWE